MMGIRFPLRSGVDPGNINSASRGDHFSSTGNMALPVAGEIDALARASFAAMRFTAPHPAAPNYNA
jgi:hypothetical protein